MPELEVFHAVFPEYLRDRIVDSLLAEESLSGFSLVVIDGHSRNNIQFDRLEQVVGYRRMIRLEILVTEQEKQRVINILKQGNTHTKDSLGIRYYVTPVLESGHL